MKAPCSEQIALPAPRPVKGKYRCMWCGKRKSKSRIRQTYNYKTGHLDWMCVISPRCHQ